ncbi:hypothetical protein CMK14_24405 [Candidatus Poribacteria bacterium]|nr:hypothetical protein [Candidatus Poribacteria bacterium]
MFFSTFSPNQDFNDPGLDRGSLPSPVAIIGLIGGILLLAWGNHLMGMSTGFAFLFVVVFLGMYMSLT